MLRFLSIRMLTINLWLGIVVCGLYAMAAYKAIPGQPAESENTIAGATSLGPFRLVMYVHPQCPCTVASLHELERIVRNSAIPPAVEVAITQPAVGVPLEVASSLLVATSNVPGAVIRQATANEARKLGAITSGYVLVYDADNRIRYHGGLTRARGHEGESAGGRAVGAILAGDEVEMSSGPVFGCGLFDPGDE